MRDFSQSFNKHIHQLEAIASENHSENSVCFYQELFVSIPLEGHWNHLMDKSETLLWSENNSSIFQLLKYENI